MISLLSIHFLWMIFHGVYSTSTSIHQQPNSQQFVKESNRQPLRYDTKTKTSSFDKADNKRQDGPIKSETEQEMLSRMAKRYRLKIEPGGWLDVDQHVDKNRYIYHIHKNT